MDWYPGKILERLRIGVGTRTQEEEGLVFNQFLANAVKSELDRIAMVLEGEMKSIDRYVEFRESVSTALDLLLDGADRLESEIRGYKAFLNGMKSHIQRK